MRFKAPESRGRKERAPQPQACTQVPTAPSHCVARTRFPSSAQRQDGRCLPPRLLGSKWQMTELWHQLL